MRSLPLLFALVPTVMASVGGKGRNCKDVSGIKDIDLETYVNGGRWYVQQQMATLAGNPGNTYSRCVYAEYKFKSDTEVAVHNYAEETDGTVHDANLCAYIPDVSIKSQLAVGPCFLPKIAYGPYWIVAYSESEGYVLVSGGQPTIETKPGLCTTGMGVNNAGLWIMTRKRDRDQALVQKVREVATSLGYDVSVLNDVDQCNCDKK